MDYYSKCVICGDVAISSSYCPACKRNIRKQEYEEIKERNRLEEEEVKEKNRLLELSNINSRKIYTENKNQEELKLREELSKIAYLDKHDTEKIKKIINLTINLYPTYIDFIYAQIKLLGKEFESAIIDLLYERTINFINSMNLEYFSFYNKKNISLQEKCFQYFYDNLVNYYGISDNNYKYDLYLKKIIDKNIVLQIIDDLINVNSKRLNSLSIENKDHIDSINKGIEDYRNSISKLNQELNYLQNKLIEIENDNSILQENYYNKVGKKEIKLEKQIFYTYFILFIISMFSFYIKYKLNIIIYNYFHIVVFFVLSFVITYFIKYYKNKELENQRYILKDKIIKCYQNLGTKDEFIKDYSFKKEFETTLIGKRFETTLRKHDYNYKEGSLAFDIDTILSSISDYNNLIEKSEYQIYNMKWMTEFSISGKKHFIENLNIIKEKIISNK